MLIDQLGEQKIDVVLANDKNRPIEQIALRDGVMIDDKKIRVEKYLNQCLKHNIRIEKAFNKIKKILPLSADKYANLSDDDIEAIDQYLFRFAKLQDAIEKKVFPLIISDYVDDISGLTFIDILNRLEKIGILENADKWKNLRTIRQDISHQYDDEPVEMAQALNNIFTQKEELLKINQKIVAYYRERNSK